MDPADAILQVFNDVEKIDISEVAYFYVNQL